MDNELPMEDYVLPSVTIKQISELFDINHTFDSPIIRILLTYYHPDMPVKCRYIDGFLESLEIPIYDDIQGNEWQLFWKRS